MKFLGKICLSFLLLLLLEVKISHSRVIQKRSTYRKRIVCYYANWSIYRPGNLYFTPEDIDPNLCTHLIYAYASLEKDGFLVPFDPNQDLQLEGYKKFINLKKKNPDLKIMLGVGGSKAGSAKFSKIAGDPELRKTFIENVIDFLRQYGFDGIDIVWKYPGYRDGSSANDKENFVKLLKELRKAFRRDAITLKKPSLIVSIILPSLSVRIDRGYNLEELSKYVSFMTILSYDYHSPTDSFVHHTSPTYRLPGEDLHDSLNIDTTIGDYLQRDIDPEKLNMAIPLFGLSFELEDPKNTDIGSLAAEEGEEVETGYLYYNQVCQRLKEGNWTIKHVNKTAIGPYAYRGTQWMSYDDEDTIRNKAKYALDHSLGGITFWTIDYDDFSAVCHNRTYPLIRATREVFFGISPEEDTFKPRSNKTTPEPPQLQETTTKGFIKEPVLIEEVPISIDAKIASSDTNKIPLHRKDNTTDQEKNVETKKGQLFNKDDLIYQESSTNSEDNDDQINQDIAIQRKGVKSQYDDLIPLSVSDALTDTNEDSESVSVSSANNHLPQLYKINGQRDIIFQNIRIWVTHNHFDKKN